MDLRLLKDESFSREVIMLDCLEIVWKNIALLSKLADKNSDHLCLLTVFIARRHDYLSKLELDNQLNELT